MSNSFPSDGVSRAEDYSVAPNRRSTPKIHIRVTLRRCEAKAVQPESGPVQKLLCRRNLENTSKTV